MRFVHPQRTDENMVSSEELQYVQNFFTGIIMIVLSSCYHKQPEMAKPELSGSDDDGPFARYQIERRFTLPYPEDMRLNSNSLIFYRTSAFDTS
jgi:hypothetical protein